MTPLLLTDDREQSTEYRVQSTEQIRLLYCCQLPPKIVPIFSSLFEAGQLYCFAVQFKLTSLIFGCARFLILPRRRGSGSDVVDDEGVETRGKAESRKKKVEIANSRAISICQLPPKKHLR